MPAFIFFRTKNLPNTHFNSDQMKKIKNINKNDDERTLKSGFSVSLAITRIIFLFMNKISFLMLNITHFYISY